MTGFFLRLYHSPYFWRGVARGTAHAFSFAFVIFTVFFGLYILAVACLAAVVFCVREVMIWDHIIMELESDDTSED